MLEAKKQDISPRKSNKIFAYLAVNTFLKELDCREASLGSGG